MNIAYLDCASGISGDMTLGALVDAGVPLAALQAGIDSLGLPSCKLVRTDVKKKGFRASQIVVEHEPEHKHRHLHHITAMIEGSALTERQQALAKKIFGKIAVAEAKVHGSTIEKVHFHEVGAVDSIADVVGAAIGWDLLGVERIVASAVPTGQGFIEIAHGRCSIPAPATAEILQGIPLAASNVEAELTTPTGAAILASLVDAFGPLPAMTIDRIGYGAGQRELAGQPNLVRLLVGRIEEPAPASDTVWTLEANLDDATGETIGHAISKLWEAGALDVFATSIQMKKNRPGVMLTVLCRADEVAQLESLLFCETTTLGVRRWPVSRHTLPRKAHAVSTSLGEIAGQLALLPNGKSSFAPEYEACRKIAEAQSVALREVYRAALAAFVLARGEET
jgi:uncharacterized protein (TIGR00299 family) protein